MPTPSKTTMRRAFKRSPEKPNSQWGKEWGISRERVRQIRAELGLPPASEIQGAARALERDARDAARVSKLTAMSDRTCPVCGEQVREVRIRTCSAACAQKWRGNSKHRNRVRANAG